MQKEEFLKNVMVHKNKMYRFALSYLKDEAEAGDVVQDMLLRLWETRDRLGELRSLEAWCMTLTRNKCLDQLKRADRKMRVENGDDTREQRFESSGDSPHHALENKELGGLIEAASAGLPEKQRAAFHLRDVQGYSYTEICELLEIDMNQVKVNIFRARKALREALTKMRNDESRTA
ncbi:MAG: RNA polymerase sigma factor [Cryomorphaceae bacterium]|nr:sigma-70 family RNA polymerase sigma factor [Flavobacteriales bacterium]